MPGKSSAPKGPRIPTTTQLRDLYQAMRALKEDEQTELAEFQLTHPKRLTKRFLESVKASALRPPTSEPFFDTGRADPLAGDPVPPGKIKSTFDFATQVARGDLHQVDHHPELAFRYVDREIFPARTTEKRHRWSKRTLDLLLVSDSGRMVVGELKRGADSLAYLALVQALMHAAELVSAKQRARLDAVYNPFADFNFSNAGPWVDLYVIEYDAPKSGAFRKRSFEQARAMADLLLGDTKIASILGRIVFLKAVSRGRQLGFEVLVTPDEAGAARL